MATKNRILFLMEYLQQHSDESHPVTTAEIRDALARQGCPIIISTLRNDIESLRSAGYDIQINETEGMSTTYSWLDREWSLPELQILVDAVSSAQFIPVEKSCQLIEKLVSMGAPSFRDKLRPQILVSENVKAPNQQILLSVQVIRRAIDQDRKITFKYLEYDFDKNQVPRHAGTPEEDYCVSPYATIWNNDRYYLIGWSDKREKVTTYRIDRMIKVRKLPKPRVPTPDYFRVQDYTDKVFWMFGGSEERVTLHCQRSILDQVIDKFGKGIDIRNVQNDTFDITVTVDLSTTFYAWITQFVGEMTIVAPDHVRDAYTSYLQNAIDDVLNTK